MPGSFGRIGNGARARRSFALAVLLAVTPACRDVPAGESPNRDPPEPVIEQDRAGEGRTEGSSATDEAREVLVRSLGRRGIADQRVLDAMRRVPRHRFIPRSHRGHAYEDRALPIERGQTISQPYIVAYMTEMARVEAGEKVLEVGTGSGYQAAVLAEMGVDVYSIEIIEELSRGAAGVLGELGLDRVHLRVGDGYAGWPEHAPFDAVIVTAAAPHIPTSLVEQLARGGRLVIPVDGAASLQWIWLVERDEDGRITRKRTIPVRFVDMTGRVREPAE